MLIANLQHFDIAFLQAASAIGLDVAPTGGQARRLPPIFITTRSRRTSSNRHVRRIVGSPLPESDCAFHGQPQIRSAPARACRPFCTRGLRIRLTLSYRRVRPVQLFDESELLSSDGSCIEAVLEHFGHPPGL